VVANLDVARMGRLGAPIERRDYARGSVGGLDQGLWVVAWVQVIDERVTAASFEVYGSLEALAIANWFAELVVGHAPVSAQQAEARGALEALGLPPESAGAALRIEDALAAALRCEITGGRNGN